MDANLTAQIEGFFANHSKGSPVKETCVMCMEVGLHSNWVLANRFIAIVKRNEWHAFAIMSAVKLANNRLMDITVDNIFPVDKNFKCDTEKSIKPLNGGALMTVTAEESKFVFEFENATKARQFWHIVSDVLEIVGGQNDLLVFCDYSWLDKYKAMVKKGYMVSEVSKKAGPTVDVAAEAEDAALQSAFVTDPNDPFYSGPNTNGGMVSERKSVPNLHAQITSEKKLTHRPWSHQPKSQQPLRESEQSIMTLLEDLSNSQSDDQRMMFVRMKSRQKEYVEADTRTVFVGTWNVNGKVDDSLNLAQWLCHVEGPPPDIYAIGFQEMDLNLSNVALNKSTSNAVEDKWLRLIEAALPSGVSYKRLERSRLAGIFLVVYCKVSIIENIGDVAASSVPTGMFNVLGNKGAVAVRFRWHSSTMCFVCCHLAAGESEQDLEGRNRDYRFIAGRMQFSVDRKTIGFDAHDLIYFFGDLNYRIDLEAQMVKELIKMKDYEKLHDYDELFRQRLKKKILIDFKEESLNFQPSYKFDINTDRYDTSEKNRVPSYCDRILWRGINCRAITYTSIMGLRISDHKPVGATFEIGVRRIVPYLARRTYEAVIRQMDVMHNLTLPKANLSSHSVDFGVVRFMETKQGTTILKNDGQSVFQFLFKPCPGGPNGKERLFPPWLTIEPQRGILAPNESKELNFEVYINNSTVADFNAGREKIIEGTLILSLEGGRDLFITCEGQFRPSSFGLPLQTLIRLKQPAASYSLKDIARLCKNPIEATPQNEREKERQPFCFIKELWRLCNHVENHGMEESGLFQRPGIHGEIVNICEALDTCPAAEAKTPLPPCSIHSITEAMLLFLTSMPESIIPSSFNERILKASRMSFSEAVQVIRSMPKENRDVFHYLVLFMKRVLEFQQKNQTDVCTVASLFVEVMTKNIPPERRMEKVDFLTMFLQKDSKDLGF